jgi:hypothetical protein
MAITYKKPLKTITVKVHGIDTAIEVADTVSAPNASNAVLEFEKGYKMHLVTDDGTVVVPYHAVEAVTITTAASDEITKSDPYCEESGETGETETGETETGETETGETETGETETGETV